MKLVSVLAVACLAAAPGTVFAADLMTRKAPVAAPPPPYSWAGFYVGLNAGYAWSSNSTNYNYLLTNPADLPAFLASGEVSSSVGGDASGFIGGGQVGYNYQIGQVVLGLEADIQYVHQKSNGSYTYSVGGPGDYQTAVTSAEAELNWLGTVRARLGFAADRVLVYATGGLAYGGVSTNSSVAASSFDPIDGAFSALWAGSDNGTKVGWTIGGGVEYAFTNNLTLRGEYLYYDLGSADYTLTGGSTDPGDEFLGANASYKFAGSIVRAGVNWKF